MEKIAIVVAPLEGSYRVSLTFLIQNLDQPATFEFIPDELANFTAAIVMHNGIWRMQNQQYGIEVRMVFGNGQPPENKLMLVDLPFHPTKMTFIPLETEGEGEAEKPVGAEMLMSPASFAIVYGNECFWENVDEWEEEEYSTPEIIRALGGELMCPESPWKGFLFVHHQDVFKEADTNLGENVLLAEEWTFLDGSIVYLTAHGVQDEDEFQQMLLHEKGVKRIDADFGEYEMPSTQVH